MNRSLVGTVCLIGAAVGFIALGMLASSASDNLLGWGASDNDHLSWEKISLMLLGITSFWGPPLALAVFFATSGLHERATPLSEPDDDDFLVVAAAEYKEDLDHPEAGVAHDPVTFVTKRWTTFVAWGVVLVLLSVCSLLRYAWEFYAVLVLLVVLGLGLRSARQRTG